MFVYFSLLAYFRHVAGWFPVVSFHEVHKLYHIMQGKNNQRGVFLWGLLRFCNFEFQGITPDLVSEAW